MTNQTIQQGYRHSRIIDSIPINVMTGEDMVFEESNGGITDRSEGPASSRSAISSS